MNSFISFMNEPNLIGKDDCKTKTHTPHKHSRTHAVAGMTALSGLYPSQPPLPGMLSCDFFPSQIDATHDVSYCGLQPSNDMHLKLLNGTCNFNVFNYSISHVWAPLQTFTLLQLRHKACSHWTNYIMMVTRFRLRGDCSRDQ